MTSTRRITKPIERARPLRSSTSMPDQSLEMILSEMDYVTLCLNDKSNDRPVLNSIVTLCENLKKYGSKLEKMYKDQLDRCYVSLRNGCREDKLPLGARFRLLEVIELRAMNWDCNKYFDEYYRRKCFNGETDQIQQEPYSPNLNLTRTNSTSPSSTTPTANIYSNQSSYGTPMQHTQPNPLVPMLAQGQILKSSGKFAQPARVPGKNLCKDEVVIRNVDSGKVMGLKGRRVHMIEELSETVISFQRVNPGARERLVQITGPNEENLRHASQLMKDTIIRNASPIRDESNSAFNIMGGGSPTSSQTSDEAYQNTFYGGNVVNKKNSLNNVEEPIGEYRYTVVRGNESIRITGTNLSFVKTAKLILEESFRSEEDINRNSTVITSDFGDSIPSSLPSPPTMSCSPTTDHQYNFIDCQNNNRNILHSSPTSTTVEQAPLVKSPTLTVVRKPLIPMCSKTDIENAEKEETATIKEAKMRRSLFAQTSENRSSLQSNDGSLSPVSSGVCPNPSRITYSREFLAKCADNRLSQRTPKDWSKVIRTYPTIVKKSYHHLATLIVTMNDNGDNYMNECESYLQDEDLYASEEILKNPNRKWTFLRKSSFNEDEEYYANHH